MRSGNLQLICSLGGVFTTAFSTHEFCVLSKTLTKLPNCMRRRMPSWSHWSPKISTKSRLPRGLLPSAWYPGKNQKRSYPQICHDWKVLGSEWTWRSFYLSMPGMHPLPLPACMCASSESWAVTYTEQQCGWECAGECRGCHNRKHRDITCPSGVTEADGAEMWLHDPRGIWLRRRGVLSSFLRQREEESGAGLAVCVLSARTKRHQ